jgi:hypothetical protein
VLRLFYLVYFVVATGLVLSSISRLVFGWGSIKVRLLECAKEVGLSVVWPFALLSQGGRSLISKLLTKFI